MKIDKRRLMSGLAGWLACAFGIALLAGCRPCSAGKPDVTWVDLIKGMTNIASLAELNGLSATLDSSHDRAWGNDDYNNFLRAGPKGWEVIADLKGPGYVSRFWFTGIMKPHGLRFYFDGEKKPRIDMTVQQFCGAREPFVPPLAANENLCWYNLVPIPYAGRLVIMTEEGGKKPDGWPRLFYQVSSMSLPPGRSVESFPRLVTPEQRQALADVSRRWNCGEMSAGAGGVVLRNETTLTPGSSNEVFRLEGPGLLYEIRMTPRLDQIQSALRREQALRDVILRIKWDDSPFWSVEAPLGDFFGSYWLRTRYESACFGMTGDTFVCRFPMPFQKSAVIALSQEGVESIPVITEVRTNSLPNGRSWGYFHACWNRSGPDPSGVAHVVAKAAGRGKYAGCLMSAVSLDKSWWMLEGDDFMFLNGAKTPVWKGTGLEDYFSGGWYYHNVLARPFHGLVFKSPFRTVQYRIHAGDPVSFDTAFAMTFERGPQNASRGWMESTAFYYLSAPAPSGSGLRNAGERRMPVDPQLAPATVMIELGNYERFGDYAGAVEYIRMFLEQYPDHPFAAMLRLRALAYRERLEGIEPVRKDYQAIAAGETNALVRAQAQALLWYHESSTNALLGVYGNRRIRVYFDGRELGETANEARLALFQAPVKEGKHALVLQSFMQNYPDWAQAFLRMHGGNVMTKPEWKWACSPPGKWWQIDYPDAAWPETKGAIKGPPEEPWFWLEPNAMIDMQSMAKGIRPIENIPDKPPFFVFRRVFETDESGRIQAER